MGHVTYTWLHLAFFSREILIPLVPLVGLVHLSSDRGSGTDLLFIPTDICSQPALILVDDVVVVCASDARGHRFNFQYMPFWFFGIKWEPIQLSWRSLGAYCVIMWRQIPHLPLGSPGKRSRRKWTLGSRWFCNSLPLSIRVALGKSFNFRQPAFSFVKRAE